MIFYSIFYIYNFGDSMLTILKHGYKVTKPRVKSSNVQALNKYRKQLKEARVRAHKQSVIYLNKIEDEFLQSHKKRMQHKHFSNQCNFRAKIARHSYMLYEGLQKDKQKHKEYLNKMEKFVRQQQIKKLNRDRIKKILEYESANYWLEGQNLEQKIIHDRILPEYIGSTEYYHKLHTEALAYDDLNFELLHQLSSNQESVKYKNQYLIPIYKQVLAIMREVKFTDEERAEKQFQNAKIQIEQKFKNNGDKLNQQLFKIKTEFENKLVSIKQNMTNPEKKGQYLKSKLKSFILLLKKWKQYTDILGMTSVQILKLMKDNAFQPQLQKRTAQLQKQIGETRNKTFVEAVEEDTEDEQITLTNFLQNNKQSNKLKKDLNNQMDGEDYKEELAKLLREQQSVYNQISSQLIKNEQKIQTQAKDVVNVTKNLQQFLAIRTELNIDEGFLNKYETTSSIEVMKQQFKDDESFKSLLDIAGELTLQYPKLFKKVWDIQIL